MLPERTPSRRAQPQDRTQRRLDDYGNRRDRSQDRRRLRSLGRVGRQPANVDRATAEQLVAAAHEICPFSSAVRNNIDVDIALAEVTKHN